MIEQIGNVKKVGLTYLYEKYEDGPGNNPLFNDKVVISLGITLDPEKGWPNDKRIEEYTDNINRILARIGILSFRVIEEFKGCDSHPNIAVEFPTLYSAQKLFNMATDAGIGDIYLYENGQLRDKLD